MQAEGVREAFCVLPAHTNPQKVSGGLMQPLSDAVCYSSQMAKVELERLSGNSYARANLLTISRVIAT
jgi:hypothetical protein